MKFKKALSIFISFALIIQSTLPGFGYILVAKAQEGTQEEIVESSPEPTPEPSVEPLPSSELSTESLPEISPTPIPSPTPPPYWSPEYDEWKAQQDLIDQEEERADDLMEQREDEWEANEESQTWIDAHGGSEEYYASGQWEVDQAALALAVASSGDSHPQSCGEEELQPGPDTALISDTETVDGSAASSESTDLSVSNDNCASIENDSYAGGISGDNTQTGNDGPVDMATGDADAQARLVSQGNSNTTSNDDGFSQGSAEAGNSFAEGSEAENLGTGEDSENLAQASEQNSLTVDNSNTAFVDNEMTVEGVSGSNIVTDNDGNATLTTGDIELIANMLNILNLNITGEDFLHLIVNIFGQLNGTIDLDDIAAYLGLADDDDLEIIARNENTGEDSENTVETTVLETTNVNNVNNAEVNNEMNVSGVSGANDVLNNDGGADVVTGRIRILANLMNFINANFSGERWSFIMVNIFGGLVGDIILPDTQRYLDGAEDGGALAENVNVGEDSINDSQAQSAETTSVTNTNGVELTNSVNANGISGNNDQSGNDDGDGAHNMLTGVVDVAVSLMNFLNFNITGNNWVFLVVNVFGNWMGRIVGFADIGTIDAPVDGSFAALSVGGGGGTAVTASNTNTGEGSENSAYASYTSDTTINNQNTAKVTNTMNIEGISGENAVNNNDAGTSLTTGWVEIDANLLNIINMNVAGRNWMIVFLNVFGDFVGDLFFGPPPPAPPVVEILTQTQNAVNQSASGEYVQPATGGSQIQDLSESDPSEDQDSIALLSTEVMSESNSQEVLSFNAIQNSDEEGFQIQERELTFPQNLLVKLLGLKEKIENFLVMLRDLLLVRLAHLNFLALAASD